MEGRVGWRIDGDERRARSPKTKHAFPKTIMSESPCWDGFLTFVQLGWDFFISCHDSTGDFFGGSHLPSKKAHTSLPVWHFLVDDFEISDFLLGYE